MHLTLLRLMSVNALWCFIDFKFRVQAGKIFDFLHAILIHMTAHPAGEFGDFLCVSRKREGHTLQGNRHGI